MNKQTDGDWEGPHKNKLILT